MKFATIAIIATAQAIVKREPWDKASLPECPEDKNRITMDDGETHVSKYPNVGATCQLQIGGLSLVMLGGEPAKAEPAPGEAAVKAADPAPVPEKKEDFSGLKGLEHCPDMNERFTLANGRTLARAYPGPGYNCSNEYGLAQAPPAAAKKPEVPIGAPNLDNLEHCPDFNERYTLRNGTDMAVPYPKAGFNCNPAWSLAQAPWAANVVPANIPAGATYPAGLEHCPDRPERQTLRDGVTKPVAGVNCNADAYPAVAGTPWPYALAQGPWPANVVPANIPAGATYPAGLEHCPDRPERQTLRDGVTKPVAGVNCNADAYPAVAGVPWPYALAQGPWPANVAPANIPAGATYPAALEHCPDLPERQTLRDGVTKPVPGKNCNGDIHNGTEGAPAPYH